MAILKAVLKYLLVFIFVAGGIFHFVIPETYFEMMPGYIPWPEFMVYLSGVTEIIAGFMLAVPKTQKWGAWFVIAHLAVFFTVHIYMIQEADTKFADVSAGFLWGRIVVQFLAIALAYWYTKATVVKPAYEELKEDA